MARTRAAAALLTLALGLDLALGACSAPAATTRPATPEVGAEAGPDYRALVSAVDIDGTPIGLPPARSRATIAVFFASWCGPCRYELSMLGDIVRDDASINVVGLNAYEEWSDLSDERRLRTFLAAHAPWLRVAHATDVIMKAFGGVPRIPTMFVFDSQGALVHEFRRHGNRLPTRADIASAIADAEHRTR